MSICPWVRRLYPLSVAWEFIRKSNDMYVGLNWRTTGMQQIVDVVNKIQWQKWKWLIMDFIGRQLLHNIIPCFYKMWGHLIVFWGRLFNKLSHLTPPPSSVGEASSTAASACQETQQRSGLDSTSTLVSLGMLHPLVWLFDWSTQWLTSRNN